MRFILATIFLMFSWNSYAGTLGIVKDGTSGTIGGEIKYFKIETDLGKPHIFIVDSFNQACRIPIALLKDLGIDPVQLGNNLRNVRGNDGLILTCYMTEEESLKRFFAYRIDVESWPRSR